MRAIDFFVHGVPICKQSTRVVSGGNKVHAYTPAYVKAWQDLVAWSALEAMGWGVDMLQGELEAELSFYLPDKRKRDLDNLNKGTMDALSGVVFKDDSQVMKLTIEKFYEGDIGVMIRISERLTCNVQNVVVK